MTDKQLKNSNKLIEQYYDDALKIANTFHTKFLLQDDKEGIALLALIRASRTFKKEKKVKFGTYLFRLIYNSLSTAVNREKSKGPVYQNRRISITENPETNKIEYELKYDDYDPHKLKFKDQDETHVETIFDRIVDESIDYDSELLLKETLFLARKRLTDGQRAILDIYAEEQAPLTFEELGRRLKKSRQRVHQEVKKIRNVILSVRREQEYSGLKLTDKELEELYGR